jgi:uncharacterized protein YqeY
MNEAETQSSLARRVDADMVAALRARDDVTLRTLRLLKAAAKNAEVAKRRPLTDDEFEDVIRTQVKMRRDAATEYDRGHRPDRAAAEHEERAVLEHYLPEQFDADTVRTVVQSAIQETGAAGPADMGRVMSLAMKKLRGRADGSLVSATARELLSGRSG